LIELNPTEFASILPLLAGIQQNVLPYAICEGTNPGRVIVDRPNDPHIALIWSTVGYYFLAGDPSSAGDLSTLQRALIEMFIPASIAGGEKSLLLVLSTAGWKEYLPALLPDRKIFEIFRRPFRFDPARFAALENWRGRIPAGFQLVPVEQSLAEQVGVLASWASVDDFLHNGIGFAVLDGEELACLCTSVFASRDRVEISVDTAEKYRRKGLATIAASALIEECLRRGKTPNWECFWENELSTVLAGKLGFQTLPDYPVYYWEEN